MDDRITVTFVFDLDGRLMADTIEFNSIDQYWQWRIETDNADIEIVQAKVHA